MRLASGSFTRRQSNRPTAISGESMLAFVHVPGFYAAVETADGRGDATVPLIVGGDPRKRGTVVSVNALAFAAGAIPGMDVSDALRRCPDARVLPTRMARYREAAADMRAVLRGITDRLEPSGVDGTYLDLSAEADAISMAATCCVRVQADLGFAAVAGMGPTRFIAYLAAENPGPGGIRAIAVAEARSFLSGWPLTAIWGLGPATAAKLEDQGLTTIGDLQEISLEALQEIVGRNAKLFHALATAYADEGIQPRPQAKSLSQERTLREPVSDLGILGEGLSDLAGGLEKALRRENRATRRLTLGLRFVDGQEASRTETFIDAIQSQTEVTEVGLRLLGRTQVVAREVRRMRLRATQLSRPEETRQPRQLRLF